MLPIEIQFERSQLLPRKRGQLMKAINRGVMERQIRDRVPNHFEESAHSEYGARPRGVKYTAMKKKKVGHKRPNVLTGKLRASVLARYKITATQYGATLRMRGKTGKSQSLTESLKKAIGRLGKLNAGTPAYDKQQGIIRRLKSMMKDTRLADWQRREIAVMTPKEIRSERMKMASEFKRGATSSQYKRKRKKRIK